MISIDLETNPLKITEVTKNADFPYARYYHTMTVIAGKFYIYGGSNGSNAIDEMWIYDEKDGTSEIKEPIGLRPTPR